MDSKIQHHFDKNGNLLRTELPKRIFKYFNLNENFFSTIENSSLWFSKPNAFNDLFDVKNILGASGTTEEYFRYFSLPSMGSLARSERKRLAKFASKDRNAFENDLNIEVEELTKSCGICCFSKIANNKILWGNYADSFQGVCLEFDFNKLSQQSENRNARPVVPLEVNYVAVPKKFEYIKSQLEYGHSDRWRIEFDKYLLATKDIDWEYEREIRLFSYKSGNWKFGSDSITSVIFGTRCDAAKVDKTIDILRNQNTEIEFLRISANSSTHELETKRM